MNGKVVSNLNQFKDAMSFVPQDDIMYSELTVEENLYYACLLFNKRRYATMRECAPMVESILATLVLSNIQHSVVGDEEIKGISGGQKKRVSVGMELVKEASLFFLDEVCVTDRF